MAPIRLALLLASSLLCACALSGCEQPRVPAPSGLAIPQGTKITIDQLETEIATAARKAEADQKAEEAKARREIAKLERTAKTASDEAIAVAQDRAAEIADNVQLSAVNRQAALDSLASALTQAKADIEARKSFIQAAFDATTQAANVAAPLIPGGGLITTGLAIVGGLFGLTQRRKAQQAESDHDETREHFTNLVNAIDVAKEKDPAFKAAFKTVAPTIQEWAGVHATALVTKAQGGVL